MATNKQAGNVVQWIILGIVVIGVAVAIIWRYNEAEKAQDAADQAANNQSNVKPQTKDVVTLPDWDVEIKDAQKTYGTLTAEKDSDVYVLTSSKLKDGTYTCEDETHKGVLGNLRQTDEEDSVLPSVKIGDKYYSFVSALQNVCYEEEELNKLGEKFGNDLSSLLVESK